MLDSIDTSEPAPFYADVADGPAGGAAHWVTAADGLRIRVGHWPAEAAKGTVIIFPGRTEYVEKYGRVARVLTGEGYATVAIDWRGQGIAARMQPDRTVGHVDDFSDYQYDVTATLAHIEALGLPKPYMLIGHSMGGCIGLRSVMDGLDVAAAVFSAPMWGIQISAALRPIAWGLSTISKPLRFSHIFAPGQQSEPYVMRSELADNRLTADPEYFDFLRMQLTKYPDLALGGPSLHWLNEALVEMRALAALPSPDLPCLCLLGGAEAIVDPDRIRDRMDRWPGSELLIIDGGRHEVMMETPERQKLLYSRMLPLFASVTG